jgi:hypothetical protein
MIHVRELHSPEGAADVAEHLSHALPDVLSSDRVVEAPRALATLIDPNLRFCGTVDPHGVAEVVLPETGVCSTDIGSAGGSCCS